MRTGILTAIAAMLTSSLGLLLTGASAAQEPPEELARICAGERVSFSLPPFGLFDADGDLLIVADEADRCGALQKMFSRLDLDASGSLSRAEYDGFAELWRRRVLSLRGEPEPG